jgi:hypothetical protein
MQAHLVIDVVGHCKTKDVMMCMRDIVYELYFCTKIFNYALGGRPRCMLISWHVTTSLIVASHRVLQ